VLINSIIKKEKFNFAEQTNVKEDKI
jgi:hypothetical protein